MSNVKLSLSSLNNKLISYTDSVKSFMMDYVKSNKKDHDSFKDILSQVQDRLDFAFHRIKITRIVCCVMISFSFILNIIFSILLFNL